VTSRHRRRRTLARLAWRSREPAALGSAGPRRAAQCRPRARKRRIGGRGGL